MQPLLILTAVDVRRATITDSSRATTITKMVLPPIRTVTSSHNPGGGVMAVDFAQPRIQAIEPAFTAAGIDGDIFEGFGLSTRWTFAAAMRDKKTGLSVPVRGEIEGAIVEWTPDESDPTAFLGCNHAIKEVTHYEVTLDGKELYYVDFFERVIRRNGVDLFEADRRALGA